MGLVDEIRDAIGEAVDNRTDDKVRVGFDSSVCEGCPHRGDGPLMRCGMCGCPTLDGAMLDQLQMVPRGCPRIPEHERESDRKAK